MHTSCSKPLNVGQAFGTAVSITLTGFVSEGQSVSPVAPSGFHIAVSSVVVKDRNVDLSLTSFGSAQVIDSIDVTWPAGTNKKLKKVKLDGATLFDTALSGGSQTVPGTGAWKGSQSDRTVTAGGTGPVRFEFESNAAPTGYAIVVHFVGGGTTTTTF